MAVDRTSRPEPDDAPEDVAGSQHGDTPQDDTEETEAEGGAGAQPELPEPKGH